MSTATTRDRVAVVAGHLLGSDSGGGSPSLAAAQTSAPTNSSAPADLEYAVTLPERLDDPGPWPVRR
jgi:hypothetical protein